MKGEEELRRLLNAHADAPRHSVTAELTPKYQLKTTVRGPRCRRGRRNARRNRLGRKTVPYPPIQKTDQKEF